MATAGLQSSTPATAGDISVGQHAVGRTARRPTGLTRARQVALPVLVVALVLVCAVGVRVDAYGGNLTGLVQFGSNFASAVHPPAGSLVGSSQGYDGQFFYVQAQDPLLVHNATVSALRAAGQGFRLQRVGYPALAFLFAAGQRGALPVSLLVVNLLVILALTGGLAVYARARGFSTMWAVAAGLMPGMLLPVLRDLSDPLSAASMLLGLLLWRDGRRWPAALALTFAVLTREVMLLAVLAVLAETVVRAYRHRGRGGVSRRLLVGAWPVVVFPSAVWGGWLIYVMIRFGGPLGGADLEVPFFNLVYELRDAFRGYFPTAIWDLTYVLLILAATLAAFRSLLDRVTITSTAACALALGVLIPTLGDVWSDTRLSAPLFILLLVDGLHRRHRGSLLIVAGAAAMTLLIPLAIPASV